MTFNEAPLGLIELFVGDFAPTGWLPCDGRELKIHEYDTLFTLLKGRFGGDEISIFNLPKIGDVGGFHFYINTKGLLNLSTSSMAESSDLPPLGDILLLPFQRFSENWKICDGSIFSCREFHGLGQFIAGQFDENHRSFNTMLLPNLPAPSGLCYCISNNNNKIRPHETPTAGSVGTIRLIPKRVTYSQPNWHECNGQSLPIEEFPALFSLMNITGKKPGDHFNLPNLKAPHANLIYIICSEGDYPSRH